MKKEYTCPECRQTGFKSPAGLRGHRQFKHGVRPSGAQLPLEQQDLLVTESKLEQLLNERFAFISGHVDALGDDLQQLTEAANSAQQQRDEQIVVLEQRLSEAERKAIDDFTPREKAEFIIPWMQGLNGEDFVRLALETGHEAQLVPTADPEAVTKVAEVMRRQEREEAKVIQGKTELPGYRYLENLDLSVFVGEDELANERKQLIKATVKRFNEELEKFGDRVVNTVKLETELIKNLAEIQRRRREGTL